jgi:hypothetical protein
MSKVHHYVPDTALSAHLKHSVDGVLLAYPANVNAHPGSRKPYSSFLTINMLPSA